MQPFGRTLITVPDWFLIWRRPRSESRGVRCVRTGAEDIWLLPIRLPARPAAGIPRRGFGWGGRIRTSGWRNQNPLPYHLATPQRQAGDTIGQPGRTAQPEPSWAGVFPA